MNFRTTIVLLFMVLVVGAYFILVERDSQTTHERERIEAARNDGPGEALFPADQFSTESATRIDLQLADGPLVLEKKGTDWWQTRPVLAEVNTWSARQVIDDAASLRYTQKFMPGQEGMPTLEDTGLSPPAAVVTITLEGASRVAHSIQLGRAAVGGWGYVMLNKDRQVYVVGDALHKLLVGNPINGWRTRVQDVPSEGRASHVELIQADAEAIRVIKHEGEWYFEPPHHGRVDPGAIDKLLGAAGRVSVSRYVADRPEDLSLYGLDQPTLVLTVQTPPIDIVDPLTGEDDPELAGGEPTELTLRIGGPVDLKNEEVFGAWAIDGRPIEVVFALSKTAIDSLATEHDSLRDPRLTAFSPEDVSSVRIEKVGETTVGLAKGVDGWSFDTEDPGYAADGARVASLIEALCGLRAESYTGEYKPGGDPVAKITLSAVGQPGQEVLRVYEGEEPEQVRVVRIGEVIACVVPTQRLDAVFKSQLALRERVVLDATADRLAGVSIHNSHGVTYDFTRTPMADPSAQTATATSTHPSAEAGPGLWRLTGHDAFEIDTFTRLIGAMLPLRAERWLSETEDAADGDGVKMKLRFLDGQEKTLRVELPGREGTVDGLPGRFVVSRPVAELADAEFRERTVLELDIDSVESVALAGQGTAITVSRDAAGRLTSSDPGALDEQACAALLDTVAGLRVRRYVDSVPDRTPVRTVTVTVSGGAVHELVLFRSADVGVYAGLNERFFILDQATADELLSPGSTQASPTEDSRENGPALLPAG